VPIKIQVEDIWRTGTAMQTEHLAGAESGFRRSGFTAARLFRAGIFREVGIRIKDTTSIIHTQVSQVLLCEGESVQPGHGLVTRRFRQGFQPLTKVTERQVL